MGRPPRKESDSTGAVTIRTRFGPHTWALIQAYAQRLGVTDDVSMKILMGHIEATISSGAISWLPADLLLLAKSVRAGRPIPGTDLMPDVDLSKLHRSEKTRSGFVGVYLNGAGFRATGRKGEYLGTFEDAISAAHKRYMYYKSNNMPYGEMELAVDDLRRNGEKGTDNELRAIVLQTARHMGITHMYEPEEDERPAKPTRGAGPSMSGFGDNATFEAAQAKLKARDAAEERAGDKLYLRPARDHES